MTSISKLKARHRQAQFTLIAWKIIIVFHWKKVVDNWGLKRDYKLVYHL